MTDRSTYSYHILIADDDDANVEILKRLMGRLDNVRISTAYDGREALEVITEERVDIALLDVMMPDINGNEVLRFVRDIFDRDELPVVMLSALDSSEDIASFIESGANDYIVKPYAPRVVITRIQNQLYLLEASRARKHALQMALQADETKTRLLRIASHDIKNPLNNLSLILNILQDEPSQMETYLPMAERSVNTIMEIIEDFMDSEVLHDGEIGVDIEPVNVHEVLFDVMQTYEHTATNKGVNVLHEVTPATVMADKKRLEQVLANIVSNGIKYTHPGTTVVIQGEIDEMWYQVDVIDEGSGIAPEEAHRLFKPFSRLSPMPTAGESSTGLGLWIVKQMVEAQGGEVGVNLEVTQGADFWVRLPLAT